MSPAVFIVDPDPLAQNSVAQLVGSMGLQCEQFDSPQSFFASAGPQLSGCIVLEFHLPGMSGLEFQKQLLVQGIDLPLVFVTAHGDMPTAVAAMKSGAVDFMSKPFRVHELYDAIQQALLRDQQHRARNHARTEASAKLQRLTAGEQRVLERIVAGQSKQAIAQELGLSVRTIEVRRAKIMKKLQASTLADLIRISLLAVAEN